MYYCGHWDNAGSEQTGLRVIYCVIISLSGWGPSVQSHRQPGSWRINLITAGLWDTLLASDSKGHRCEEPQGKLIELPFFFFFNRLIIKPKLKCACLKKSSDVVQNKL